MRILVADDTEIVRVYLGETLRAHGCAVEAVADGHQALAAASATQFDVLLLDLRMPGLFGDVVLARLRSDPSAGSHTTPAIAMSSELDPESAAELVAAGFSAALGKPAAAGPLMAAVRAAVRPRQHQPAPVTTVAPRAESRGMELSQLPLLDDERAVTALGKPALVPGLRVLFRQELQLRAGVLDHAVQQRDEDRVRELVHQLLASCALSGATRMEAALRALRATVAAGDWAAAAEAADRLADVIADLQRTLPTA